MSSRPFFQKHFCFVTRAVLCAGIVLIPSLTTAHAGGKALACYEKKIIPAQYQLVRERVLVKPAHNVLIKHPAVYGYQTRQVVVEPARSAYQTVAPVYRWHKQRVQVQPETTGWEYRTRNGRQIMCQVRYPAKYRTVREKVLVTPGHRVRVTIPAVYGTVKEKIVIKPGYTEKRRVEAVYKTVSRKVKVQNAQAVWQPVRLRRNCR